MFFVRAACKYRILLLGAKEVIVHAQRVCVFYENIWTEPLMVEGGKSEIKGSDEIAWTTIAR